ncbi:Insect cuticle protein [Trinorchestia longiramus]|nr:Insect cuticle protein [Trinorchestia longiramus]
MKVLTHVQLLLVLVSGCVSAPAQLGLGTSPNKAHNLVGRNSYTYNTDEPSSLPDHFELAGPPPAPIFLDRIKETQAFFPSKRTSSSTTTTTLPPPPSGLYGAPIPTSDSETSNLNSNFVSLDFDLEVPEVVEVSPTPATLPTPKGFSPPPPLEMNTSMQPYMPYQIAWSVRDANAGHQFSHKETSKGEDVRGEYRVLLPDGRTQIVTFRADPSSGYNAAVTYTKVNA